MRKDKFPKISVVTPTLNNANILNGFFERLMKQNYPKEKMEIIVADGGSTDPTLSIAKKYGAKIYNNKKVLAEPGVILGMVKATGDIMTVLAADNYLNDPDSFNKIAKTFYDERVFAAFPRHESTKDDSIFTKYVNAFTDPFSHFVYGYAANGRTFKKIYKTLEHNETYDIYDFKDSPQIPLIAFAQGFCIRSGYKRDSRHGYDDIKPVMDIINSGKQIAFIYSLPLYHHTIKDLGHFIRKQRWATRNAISNKKYGISYRLQNLSSAQKARVKICPFYALSFFVPLIYSIFHLVKDKEKMWIFHSPLCFLSASASLYEIILYNTSRKEIVSRQA